MPKKRRKLSKEHEKCISIAQKEIELILAKINDINDDDIRGEYALSFAPVKLTLDKIRLDYTNIGFNDDSVQMYARYLSLLAKFKDEYEMVDHLSKEKNKKDAYSKNFIKYFILQRM